MAETDRILISLATYNERDNVAPLAQAILDVLPHTQLLVVDDNSPDGTGAAADALAAADARISVVHRAGKLGLGTAIVAGMKVAMQRGVDYFISMDADFSHDPGHLPALVERMADHDVMIGSRYVPGGGTAGWPWSRRMMSRAINGLMRGLCGLGVRDVSGGFRCYRVELLRRIDLDSLRSVGYSFQQEMLLRCVQAGGRVGETPICFADRKAGASKLSLGEICRSVTTIGMLGLRTRWQSLRGTKAA